MLSQLVEKKIELSDVIDLQFLQELQDTFADAVGVASLTVDDKGPVTRPSNFSDFCKNHIRNNPEGFQKCNECDINAGKEAYAAGKPVIYYCHAGLMDFSAPIIINGKQIGAMLGGQVLTTPPDIEKFQAIFALLGAEAEQEIRQALGEIKIVPEERIKAAAKLMYLVANALSKIGYQNLEISRNSKKINSILNSMPDGIITVDNSWVINFCNTTIEKMFGYKNSELIGQNLGFLLQAIDNDSNLTNIEDITTSTPERKGIKKDGSEFWVDLNISDVSVDNDFSRIISIRDITERKTLEKTVTDSKKQFLAILENLPFMAWLKDTEGRFIAVNKQFSENCKTPIEDILGKTDMDLFPKELAEAYHKDDRYIIKTKKQKAIEERITTPDGVQWFETFKVPILDTTGEVIGTTGYAIDVTEHRGFNKSKNEFMSIISQDLKTQLNAIRGALVIISDGLNSSIYKNAKELIDLANINNAKLINLINDIIDIENIESRSADYDIQVHDLRTIVEKVLHNNNFGVEFILENFEDETLIKIDKARLNQVLLHLFYKIADCSLSDKPAQISLNRKDGYVHMDITGFGYSIPKPTKTSLFQKFAQVMIPNNSKREKTGLELSLCKAIIESFDGNIDCETIPEGGTIFCIELPEFRGDFR